MPASLIRILSTTYMGSQVLSKLSSEWGWFEFDRKTEKVAWKASLRNRPRVLIAEQLAGFAGYFVFGMTGVMLILRNIESIPLMVIGLAFFLVALRLLVHTFSLHEANAVWKLVKEIGLGKVAADLPGKNVRKSKK